MKILLLALIMLSGLLFAEEIVQNISDEYLQEIGAKNIDDLEVIDSKVFYKGKVFSGVLYEKYDNDRLKVLENYKDGLLHGSSARWYKNGQKQMEAIFKKGKLNGYFKGWFENGDLKYDLNFIDTSRDEDSEKDDEKEGDAASGQKD
jgi:antitoxin component YwqK of YwqJK toxin-antitoxin module